MEPQETPPVEVPTPPPVTPTPPPSVFSSPLLWMLIVIIILMIIGIAFYYFVSSRQHMTPIVVKPSITTVPTTIATPPTTEPTQSAQASPSATTSDLPPLFPGVEWEATTEGVITIGKQDREILNSQGFINKSKVRMNNATIFFTYYEQELAKKGWSATLSTSSDSDNTEGYEKENKHVTVSSKYVPDSEQGYFLFVEHD